MAEGWALTINAVNVNIKLVNNLPIIPLFHFALVVALAIFRPSIDTEVKNKAAFWIDLTNKMLDPISLV